MTAYFIALTFMINNIACKRHNTGTAYFSLFSCDETLTKIQLNLSQNALKLAYTNVELKKLTSRASASSGRRAWKGQLGNGRERREAGRWKATGIAHPLISA